MSSRAPVGGTLSIEVHLRAEAASGLKAVGHRLDRQLTALRELGAQVQAMPLGAERERRAAEYDEKRREAEYLKWTLIVQREAMGLAHHEDVHELYRVPPKLS